mmetsp:Transcript_35452/g.75571  ORF Transcript_35452/g.75571 Transcript_35452/m.75571 type:complete len:228 (-) Transcript_35452:95-778(-)
MFIDSENVLLLASQREHATTFANHHQAPFPIGIVEAALVGLDGHRKVLAGRPDVDQKPLGTRGGSWELREGHAVPGVAGQRDEEGLLLQIVRRLDASLQQLTRKRALLGVMGDPNMDLGRGLDELSKGLTGHCSDLLGFLDGGDLGVAQEERLGSLVGFLLVFLPVLAVLLLVGLGDGFGCGFPLVALAVLGLHLLLDKLHEGVHTVHVGESPASVSCVLLGLSHGC